MSLPRTERVRRRGIPVTTPERTLIDVCGSLPFPLLERALDDALRRRRIHLVRLVRSLDEIPASGRRARRPMDRLLVERVPGFDAGESPAELDVLRILQEAGVRPLPVQQHRVEVEGHRYRLDLAWPETLHAMEYDGVDAHGQVSDFHGGRERLRRLQRARWTVWPLTKRTTRNEIVVIGHIATGQGM